MNIILGSKSPRRKELLKQCGISFLTDEAKVEEMIADYQSPRDYVKKIAIQKGEDVFSRHQEDLVICADTIVVLDNLIMGKPKSQTEAKTMIKALAGREHQVFTAVYLRKGQKKKTFVVQTKVTIDTISEEELNHYVSLEEPYDKAGAYAIQGFFGKYVKKINGDYYNVMGLPLNRLYRELNKFR